MTLELLKRGFGCSLLATMVFLVGCGGSGSSAKLRIMNASPDVGNINALIDDKSVASSVGYGNATDYISVDTNAQQLKIEPSGSSNVVIDQSLTIASGSNTTVVAAGFASNMSALILDDDLNAPSSGNVKLRLVNAAPGLGTVDVYVVPPGTNLLTVTPTASQVAFESASGYQTLASGTYEVIYTTPGTAFVVFDGGSFTFGGGQNRTVVALNGQSGGFSTTTLKDLN
jgi:hypothetical protein